MQASNVPRALCSRQLFGCLVALASLCAPSAIEPQATQYPQIISEPMKRSDGSVLTINFFANGGNRDSCLGGRLYPVSRNTTNPYQVFVCEKPLVNSKIDGSEYALVVQRQGAAEEWYHIIVTSEGNPDDTFIPATLIVHPSEPPSYVRLPVYASVPRDELAGNFSEDPKAVSMLRPNNGALTISSRLGSMNVSVKDFGGRIEPSDFGIVQVSALPTTLQPTDSTTVNYSVRPAFWASLGQSLMNFDPKSHDATLLIRMSGTPEPGGLRATHEAKVNLHLQAPIPLVLLCLMVGAVTGTFAARILAKDNQTPDGTSRENVGLGIVFALGAWILANVSAYGGVAVTVKGYQLSTTQPLEMAVLGFVVAGGRSVLSRLKWEDQ